ncbi:MAG: uroporphyrinogen decarboxylase family protein, partial [Oscillospiraceae bacterium]
MTKAERIRAALHGEKPDRVPYALWTHFPDWDMDPVRLASESWKFYKKLDIDFIKTMNNGMYPIEDLGCEIDYSEIPKGGVAKLISTPVHTVDDWDLVGITDPGKGALARELYSLELLLEARKKAGDDVPVVFTCFSPITIADKVSGKHLQEHLAQGGAPKIVAALERITEGVCALVRRAIELGADGIFFASQMSNYGLMDEELYRTYGVPYDRRVIEASKGWFNILHAHGDNILFDLLREYPVQAFNWHVGESLPDMDECRLL